MLFVLSLDGICIANFSCELIMVVKLDCAAFLCSMWKEGPYLPHQLNSRVRLHRIYIKPPHLLSHLRVALQLSLKKDFSINICFLLATPPSELAPLLSQSNTECINYPRMRSKLSSALELM